MQVMSLLLDEVMKDPENPSEDLIVDLDIKVHLCICKHMHTATYPIPFTDTSIVSVPNPKPTLARIASVSRV